MRYEHPIIVLTGGEPLRQATAPLIAALLADGYPHVQIETAGNLWDEELRDLLNSNQVTLVCSPKTRRLHPMIVRHCQHYKYIVRSGGTTAATDGLPVGPTQANQSPDMKVGRPWDFKEWGELPVVIWVSPCDEQDPGRNTLNRDLAVEMALKHGYRLSLQTHKLLGLR